MSLRSIGTTELGGLVAQHRDSLPMWHSGGLLKRNSPWVITFVLGPAAITTGLAFAELDASAVAGGLLAGVGVLGGLLFEVLASVTGRLATIADGMGDEPASPAQLELVNRLDIARSNIAYAALVSIVFVVELGVVAILESPPAWLGIVSTFMLMHLGTTLVLVLLRINSIGKSDRVSTITAHARAARPVTRASRRAS